MLEGNTTLMHMGEKSDKAIVPTKSLNNAPDGAAEAAEGRALAKGNRSQTTAAWTQSQGTASHGLAAVRQAAKGRKGIQLTALLHHLTVDLLRRSYYALRREATPGIDGVTWQAYGEDLERRLQELHTRLHRGNYRARPARRTYLPKADGSQRPLAIWCVEDKVVQQAVVFVLEAIYEVEFLGFSYGFRPGRGPHDALDALQVALYRRKINWILDADIQSFFDTMSQEWLMTFLKHRIGDPRLLRLIRKWLTIGVIEDGKRQRSTQGSAQGAVISPILANVYLHYVFDLWVNAWRGKRAKGQVIVIRYADDTLVGFQHKAEADQFLLQLKHRMQQFGLRLHAGKTKLLRFGRYAAAQCRALGQRKPPTLDFLGFTHYCTTARRMDWFVVGRKSQKTRLRRQLQALKQGLRQRLHAPIHATGQWLERVLQGHLNYYAVPGNGPSLQYFVKQATWYWWRSLRRRSQRHRMNWERFRPLVERYVPPIRILHAQPLHRFDARTQGKSPVR